MRTYFKQYKENYKIDKKDKIQKEFFNYRIEPIIKCKDIYRAFDIIEEQIKYLEELQKKQESLKPRGMNYGYFYWIKSYTLAAKMNILEIINKYHWTVKIEIKKNNTNKDIISGYELAKKLFLEGNYIGAIDKCRNILQVDLEKTFDSSIKHFENKNDLISAQFNKIIGAVSQIRHILKTSNFENFKLEKEKKAIAKFCIDLIASIRNFIDNYLNF